MLRACAAVAITASTNAVASGTPALAVSSYPLTDVRTLADVGFVMKGGEVYSQ